MELYLWFVFPYMITTYWWNLFKPIGHKVIWQINIYFTMPSRNRKTYELWCLLQDLIGKATLWPYAIRRLFWTRHISYFNRMLVTVFAYVNGLSLDALLQWVDHMFLCRDAAARTHIINLWRDFNNGRNGHLYGYNITMNRYETVSGNVRHYVHKTKR